MGVDINEDFLQKEEWINNIKFMSPRPRYNHIELQGEIYMQLKQYFKKRCNVSIEAALFLTKDDPIEIKSDKNQIFYRGYIGVPQLVVEVLSPSNADDDLIVKKDLYEKYGVPEYWIISPMSKKVWIYMLIDNKYELKNSCTLNDKFTSTRFEELEIDLSDVELIVEE